MCVCGHMTVCVCVCVHVRTHMLALLDSACGPCVSVLQSVSLSVKDEFKLVCCLHGTGKHRYVSLSEFMGADILASLCRWMDLHTKANSQELMVGSLWL